MPSSEHHERAFPRKKKRSRVYSNSLLTRYFFVRLIPDGILRVEGSLDLEIPPLWDAVVRARWNW